MSAISRMLVNALDVLLGQPGSAPPENSPLTPKVVLFVDGDPVSLTLGAQILSERSYTTLQAGTPSQAIKMFEDYCLVIDLVIVDVNLPGMSGFELAERVLQLNPHVPVLYTSGTSGEKTLQEGVFMIDKPFKSEELIRSVAKILDPVLQHAPDWAAF